MQYLLLIYNDDSLLQALPEGEADAMMRHCFAGADAMKAQGTLLQSQQLQPAESARSVRIRDGKVNVSDGPFAETRELLGGFNLIEADSLEQAVEIASRFPWASTGCVEVRPIRDMDAVRRQVGAPPAT
ncbi:MAG TPA: YciI family protein [Stenotrophomonas sp.]|nr:YciI family protein [Stenotrophomonas sp.]